MINSLVASAGGQIVDEDGDVAVDEATERAAEIIKRVATEAAPPGMSNNREDQARLGFEEGRSDFQVNYSFIYPSAEAIKGFRRRSVGPLAVRRARRAEQGDGGGINPRRRLLRGARPRLRGGGVPRPARQPDRGFGEGRAGADGRGALRRSEDTKPNPYADVLRESLDSGVARPVTPAYSDISLAIQKSFHLPEKIDPAEVGDDPAGQARHRAEGASSDGGRAGPGADRHPGSRRRRA